MMTEDLSTLSFDDLKKFEKRLMDEMKSREATRRQDALKAVDQVAREHGFSSIRELLGDGRKSNGKRSAAIPKFRNPENPQETWSGRGRRPHWFVNALENGVAQEEMEIKG